MRLIQWARRQDLFLRFLATYLLVIIIPLSLAMWVNTALVAQYRTNLEENQLSVLRQTRDVVERSIDELEWRIFQIAGNQRLERLVSEYRSNGQVQAQLLRDMISYLNSYTLYSGNLKSTLYLYLNEPPIIITPYTVYSHEDFMDTKTFFSMEGLSVDEWHRVTLSKYYRRGVFPARRVTIEDYTNKSMIPLVQSLPTGRGWSKDTAQGILVYFIEEEEFGSLLGNIILPPGGWAYIADGGGNILTGKSADGQTVIKAVDIPADTKEGLLRLEVDGKDFFVIHTRAEGAWEYVAILPSEPVMAPVYRLRRFSLLSLSLSMLVGMTVASVISYRRAKPLQDLVSSLREQGDIEPGRSSGLRVFDTAVHRLIDRSRYLQTQVEKQDQFNRAMLVNRLLQGSFRSRNEVSSYFAYLGISIDANCFLAMIFRLKGFETLETEHMVDEMIRTKVVLKELILKAFPGRVFMHDSDENSLAAILLDKNEEPNKFPEGFFDKLEHLHTSFGELHHPGLLIGVGNPKPDILDAVASYEEAKRSLSDIADAYSRGVILFSKDQSEAHRYFYPIELEIRISNAVLAGDLHTLDETMNFLVSENFERRHIGVADESLFYDELTATYTKLLDCLPELARVDTEDGLDSLPEADSPVQEEDGPGRIRQIALKLRELAELCKAKKRSHNSRLISGISDFISEHLTDSGLGLYSVASYFSITESYLSFFFKEQTGENFSSYVERLRIEKAVDLLLSTESGIMDVSRAVGYNNDKTFRRAFRKLKGVSPSDFRQQMVLRKLV